MSTSTGSCVAVKAACWIDGSFLFDSCVICLLVCCADVRELYRYFRVMKKFMLKLFPLTLVAFVVISLGGCKTWMKPGADGEMLAADQLYCKNEAGVSAGPKFIECMERLGWYHDSTSDVDSGSQRAASPNVEIEEAQPVVDNYDPSQDKPVSSGVRVPVYVPEAAPRPAGNWIRFGEETEPLEVAKAKCDVGNVVGETVDECMQSKGWRQIKFRITVEEPGDLD